MLATTTTVDPAVAEATIAVWYVENEIIPNYDIGVEALELIFAVCELADAAGGDAIVLAFLVSEPDAHPDMTAVVGSVIGAVMETDLCSTQSQTDAVRAVADELGIR